MNDTVPEVLIVGAGPVGLTVAAELQRYGVPFRLVDKASGPSTATKAIALHSRSLETLRAIGVAEAAIARGKPVRLFSVTSRGVPLVVYDFSLLDAAYPFVLDLPQPETERLLLEHVTEHGARVERNVEVVALSQGERSVHVQLRHEGGRIERARARYVVACDGGRGAVRTLLGLPFRGKSYHRHFLVADVDVGWDRDASSGVYFLGPEGGCVVLVPIDGRRRFRIFIEMPSELPDEASRPPLTLETFQRLCDTRCPPMTLSNLANATIGAFHHRMVDRMQVGRVFLAGDAAHVGSPIGGQYMNMGLAEATNLGWKLAYVVRGLAKPELLASYHEERHAVARLTERTADVMTRVFTTRNVVARAVRDQLLPRLTGRERVRHKLPWLMSGHKPNYREGRLTAESLDAKLRRDEVAQAKRDGDGRLLAAGDLAPDVALFRASAEAPMRLLDVTHGPTYALLLFPGVQGCAVNAGRLGKLGERLRAAYPVLAPYLIASSVVADAALPIPVLRDPDGRVHRRYGLRGGGAVLVRPDGYVAFVGQPADERTLLAYLEGASRLVAGASLDLEPPSRVSLEAS